MSITILKYHLRILKMREEYEFKYLVDIFEGRTVWAGMAALIVH